MKYWWLEKYKNFKIVEITELANDINYFLTMPKDYDKRYELLKDVDINILDEEDLLILLKKIVVTKNIKDSSLSKIINKLLLIPDDSFPNSDYSIEEILEEIKNLKKNYPYQEKLENNNIAVCYNCLNVFYVDKIKTINKKEFCLCPFCLKPKLYFDNDYIPMNYTFIKLANIYYRTSTLGCRFKEVKKILKNNVKVVIDDKKENSIDLTDIFNQKIKLIDEKIVNKKIYDLLMKQEEKLNYSVNIYIEEIKEDIEYKILILLVSIMDVLSRSVYLKNIIINTNKDVSKQLRKILKYISK